MTGIESILLTMLKKALGLSLLLAGAAAAGTCLLWSQVSVPAFSLKAISETRPGASQSLTKMDGGHLEGKVIEFGCGPAGSASYHLHPCPVVAVVESAISDAD
jgi:hypothetical protein